MPCSSDRLSIRKRKQIFRDLVAIQDNGMATPASRSHIAAAWAIGMTTLNSIELQGISGDPSWLEVYDEQRAAEKAKELPIFEEADGLPPNIWDSVDNPDEWLQGIRGCPTPDAEVKE